MTKFVYLARTFIAPGAAKSDGLRLVFDVESDGLDDATKVHCVVIADLDDNHADLQGVDEYGPDRIPAALEHLTRADYLTGHNIVAYDLPLLKRLYNWAPKAGCTIVDTLVIGRLILPNIKDLDDQGVAMGDPSLGKLHGRYSLEAWGARLGIPKIGADIEDWSKWTPEMQARCVGDVVICKTLHRFLAPGGYSQVAISLEHAIAKICGEITATGVPFDTKAAKGLCRQWTERLTELEARLSLQFPGST
jgi:hypothetical protein